MDIIEPALYIATTSVHSDRHSKVSIIIMIRDSLRCVLRVTSVTIKLERRRVGQIESEAKKKNILTKRLIRMNGSRRLWLFESFDIMVLSIVDRFGGWILRQEG